MFGLLVAGGLVILALAAVLFVAKIVLALVLIPFKIGFFLLKGFLLLVFLVPLIVLGLGAATVVVPVLFAVFGLPILLFVGGVVLLVKLLR